MGVPSFLRWWCLACAASLFVPRLLPAQQTEVQALKQELSQMQAQVKRLMERIEQLEKQKAAGAARLVEMEKAVSAARGAPSALNPAIGLAIDATAEHRDRAGGHFNFRAAELGLAASVDPFARGYAFIAGKREGVEVEEAALVTTSLPWNLSARAGRFFADFGRLAKFHEHELPFVNFPLSIERLAGGESKADGLELGYLFPTPFFLRGTLGGYNKIGEENERIDDSKFRSWSRFTYLGRLHTYFDVTDSQSVELGASLAYTPSLRAPGAAAGGARSLSGLDLTFRYQPPGRALYQGFTLGAELLANSERVERDEERRQRRRALGGYGYAELKLDRNWSSGFLFDYAPTVESPGKKTLGYSPFLTWNPSEFNRLRLQYTYLDDRVREDRTERGHQFFVQWTGILGAHTHGFRTR
jgi:hypothetical protein